MKHPVEIWFDSTQQQISLVSNSASGIHTDKLTDRQRDIQTQKYKAEIQYPFYNKFQQFAYHFNEKS